MEVEIAIGDTVRKKLDGRKGSLMTVVRIEGEDAICTWDADGETHTQTFKLAELQRS